MERVRRAECVDDVVVATTINPPDAVIAGLCELTGCNFHRGSKRTSRSACWMPAEVQT